MIYIWDILELEKKECELCEQDRRTLICFCSFQFWTIYIGEAKNMQED